MNKEEDYASSDSESDEDFCPEKAGAAAEAVSEIETDEEEVDDDDEVQERPAKGRKKTLAKKRTTKKPDNSDSDEDDEVEENGKARRSTRQTEGVSNGHGKASLEKDKIDSDNEEKSRTDALWADFMSDVKPAVAKKPPTTATTIKNVEKIAAAATSTKKPDESTIAKRTTQNKEEAAAAASKQITITEIVDFAGEEVRVQKTVSADSVKENTTVASPKASGSSSSIGMRQLPVSLKRPAAGGSGLGSILNQIGKKKKISVLEKSQLDWKSFKNDEGIEEQLQTFNKGKDGYLERQDFLQRTDLRQFEIEKNLRQTRRN